MEKNIPHEVIKTMLITLWARSVEQTKPSPIVIDKESARILRDLGYDNSYLDAKKQAMTQVGSCIRSNWFDKETLHFINNNSDAQVIQLGAGLDPRYQRIGSPSNIYRWYDLDLEDAMKIRLSLIKGNEKVTSLSMSLFDEEWMKMLASNNRPTLIILEGVLMYFKEDQIKELLSSIAKYFDRVTFLIDSCPAFLVGKAKMHDSLSKYNDKIEITWGISKKEEIEALNDGIKVDEVVFMSDEKGAKNYPWIARILYTIPFVRRKYNQFLIRFTLRK